MSTFQPQRLDGATTNVITVTSGTTLKGESMGAFHCEGMVIQVQWAETPINNTYALNYTMDLHPIPDLVIDFKPVYSTSRIYMCAMVNCNQPHVCSYGFFRDGTNMSITYNNQFLAPPAISVALAAQTVSLNNGSTNQQVNNNVHGSLLTTYPGWDVSGNMRNTWIQSWDLDNRSNARRRYQVGVNASWGDSIRTLIINDRDSYDMRSKTTFCVMEIA